MSDYKIEEVSHRYEPYSALCLCWRNNEKNGLFYDNIQPSFACHPCDLFDEDGNREEWKDLKRYPVEKCINILPKKSSEDEGFLRKHIAGGIQVSNFGRVGIPIKCERCQGCKGCKLNPENKDTVSIKDKQVEKCEKFHFVLPQYESLFWNDSEQKFEKYNGYLAVNINGKEECVYELVAEALGMKEDTRNSLKNENQDLIDYINKKSTETVKEKLAEAIETIKKGENISLQIHHINNNGHHNTPTYHRKDGKLIEGNLIALPEDVHNEIHFGLLKFLNR